MPHYDRHADPSAEQNDLASARKQGVDDAALDDAAEALRLADIEAVQTDTGPAETLPFDDSRLEEMSIDELRVIANQLDIPDRGAILEQSELIAEIRQRR